MEDDERIEPFHGAHDRLITFQYDSLKHMTSLSLLSVGGIVSAAGSIFDHVEKKTPLWVAVGMLVLAAMLAFLGQAQVLSDLEPKRVGRERATGWTRYLSPTPKQFGAVAGMSMSIGVGCFLAFAVDNLK